MAMIGNEMMFKGAVKLGTGLNAKTIPYEFKSFETYDSSKLTMMIKKVLGISEDVGEFQILYHKSNVITSSDDNYEKILDIKDANTKVIKTNDVIKSGDDVAKKTKIQTPATTARMPRMDVEHVEPNIGKKETIVTPVKEKKAVKQKKETEKKVSENTNVKQPIKRKRKLKRNVQPKKQSPVQNTPNKLPKRPPVKKKRGLLDRVMGNKK